MAVALRAAQSGNNGSGSTTITINCPTGVADDDVMLMALTTHGQANIWNGSTTNWTQRTCFSSLSVWGLAHDGTNFVAVGMSGSMAYSSNGSTWNAISTPFGTSHVYGVAYGDGKWVAVGASGQIATATTASGTWTLHGSPPFGSSTIYGVAYGNGTWVAVGAAGKLATASDPTSTWSIQTSSFAGTDNIRAVKYANSVWVAVGGNSALSAGYIATATNPTGTWTQQTSNFAAGNAYAVAYGSGRWVVVGGIGCIVSATDPTGTWTKTPAASSVGSPWTTARTIKSIMFDGEAFIACSTGQIIGHSYDGLTWLRQSPDVVNMTDESCIAYGNGVWVIGDDGGKVFTSTIGSHAWGQLPPLVSYLDNTPFTFEQWVYWKLAKSEASSYTATIGSSLPASGVIIAFSGASTRIPTVEAYEPDATAQSTNASSMNITAPALGSWSSADGVDVVLAGIAYGTSITPPTNYTEPANGESSSTGGSSASTTEVSYRLLSGVTTVGSLTATASNAAVNLGNHIFIFTGAPFSLDLAVSDLPVEITKDATVDCVTTVVDGTPETVTFSSSDLPTGVTIDFNPVSVTAGDTSVATVAVDQTAVEGDSTVNIIATATSSTKTKPLKVKKRNVPTPTLVLPLYGSL